MANSSSAWVYAFSKFTSEALLFEALAIFAILAMYTAFWVLKKRKFGVLGQYAPVGAMKHYLTEMIGDAEQMRAQLFGLLGMSPITTGTSASSTSSSAQFMINAMGGAPTLNVNDPDVLRQLQAMEAKLAEQAKAMEAIVVIKIQLEKDLEALRGGSGGDSSKLQEKIAQLEGRLAEYSVIEDDLANLKKLQQENTALKSQLGGAGGASSPPRAAEPEMGALAAESLAAEPAAAEPALAEAIALEPAMAEPILETPAAAVATESPAFENLVDQVEQSLAPEVESLPPMEAPSVAAAAPAPSSEKNDADLVAEFEKMLSG